MAFDSDCRVCRREVRKRDRAVGCSRCDAWFHISCVGVSPLLYRGLSLDSIFWVCTHCKPEVDGFMNRTRFGGLGKVNLDDSTGKKDKVVAREGNRGSVGDRKENGLWKTVVGGSGRSKVMPQRRQSITVSNRFSSLEEEPLGGTEILVYGDSIVRGMGVTSLYRPRSKRFKVSCYPGAGVNRVQEALTSVEDKPLAKSVGGNDISSLRSEELKDRFRKMLEKLRDRKSPSAIIGILPRRYANMEWSSRAIALNKWLEKRCNEIGFFYIDSWGEFINRPDRFRRDGIHLSSRGRDCFVDLVNKKFLLGKLGN